MLLSTFKVMSNVPKQLKDDGFQLCSWEIRKLYGIFTVQEKIKLELLPM